jgi:ABC-2 type transport system permease protein
VSVIPIPRTGAAEPGPRWFALSAVANETAKGLALLRRRKATLVMGAATGGMLYLMIEFFIGGGHVNRAVLAATLPALAAYTVASTAALGGAGGIAEEVNGGTLEQAHLSLPGRRCWLSAGSARWARRA